MVPGLIVAFGDVHVIVEVQLTIDPQKRLMWPSWVSTLRAQKNCEVLLLVVTDSTEVARWAAEPIPLGNPGSSFAPLVLGPENSPKLTASEAARDSPGLAILSVLLQKGRNLDVNEWEAAFAAAMTFPEAEALKFGNQLMRLAEATSPETLEAVMSTPSAAEFKRKL